MERPGYNQLPTKGKYKGARRPPKGSRSPAECLLEVETASCTTGSQATQHRVKRTGGGVAPTGVNPPSGVQPSGSGAPHACTPKAPAKGGSPGASPTKGTGQPRAGPAGGKPKGKPKGKKPKGPTLGKEQSTPLAVTGPQGSSMLDSSWAPKVSKKKPRKPKWKRRKERDRQAAIRNADSAQAPGHPAAQQPPSREVVNPAADSGKTCGGGGPSVKRSRPEETMSPRGGAKKPKVANTPPASGSYAEAAAKDLGVAITYAGTGHISEAMAERISSYLKRRIFDLVMGPSVSGDAFTPKFRGKPTYSSGALKLWCEDSVTKAWLHGEMTSLNSKWGGELEDKLAVKKVSDLQRRVRCGLLIPDGASLSEQDIARVLLRQNPWASVEKWILHFSRKVKGDNFLVVSVPEDVAKALVGHGRRLCFALGSVYVNFQNAKGKFIKVLPEPCLASPEAAPAEEHAEAPAQQEPVQAPTEPMEATATTQSATNTEGGGEALDGAYRGSSPPVAPSPSPKDPEEEPEGGEEDLERSFGDLRVEDEEALLTEDGRPFV